MCKKDMPLWNNLGNCNLYKLCMTKKLGLILTDLNIFFKASALWANASYKSKCMPVCVSIRLSVWTKKYSFLWLILPYKTRWQPRFPVVEGRIANFDIFLDVFEFLSFGWLFPFFKKFSFFDFLGPPGNHASRWIRDL